MQPIVSEGARVENERVDVNRRVFAFVPRKHLPRLEHDIAGSLPVLNHVAKRFADLDNVWSRPGEHTNARGGVRHNRSERLIDLVRERRTDFTERRNPVKTRELRFRVVELVLCLLAGRNVRIGTGHSDRLCSDSL